MVEFLNPTEQPKGTEDDTDCTAYVFALEDVENCGTNVGLLVEGWISPHFRARSSIVKNDAGARIPEMVYPRAFCIG
jgi:hypothetical protein